MKTIFMHITCWGFFISYELGSLYYYSGKLEPAYVYMTYYAINISFFYCSLYILGSSSVGILKPLLFRVAGFLLLFAAYFLVKFLTEYLFDFSGTDFLKAIGSFRKTFIISASRAFYFLLLSVFYWLAGRISIYRKKAADAERIRMTALRNKAETERRLAVAQNAYLNQQLSPHLLFNSLNFIYSSVYRSSPEGARCVLLLADIMRTSLEDNGPDGKIPLDEEILQLRRLEEINRYRFQNGLYFEMITDGPSGLFRIIPLILFTLTENVFKHGDLSSAGEPARIIISVSGQGILKYYSRNVVKEPSKSQKNGHLGLDNIRVRLDFTYPGTYDLKHIEDAGIFELYLTLHL